MILIGNNLKYDTRVKRHAKTISDFADSVHIFARPTPDDKFGMKQAAANITYSFLKDMVWEHPVNRKILEFADNWDLGDVFRKSLPVLECDSYYNIPDLERYTKILDKIVSGERWNDITSRESEKMDISNAVSYSLSFMEGSIQFAMQAVNEKADVVLCNDIDTLLAGVVHKKKYGSRLLYDFHDIMADISDGCFPQMYSNTLVQFEKHLIQYADVVMSISKTILGWSKEHYGYKAPAIPILNCSAVETKKKLPIKHTPSGVIKIYYHGMSDTSRGLMELIQAVEIFDEFCVVLRCLPSKNLDELKRYVNEKQLDGKVTFLEPVVPEEIPEAANCAGDIGFHLCNSQKCLNWRFALTNKFIEYTKGGLPVITSNTDEQGRIVRKYHNGWLLEENTKEGIIKTLNKILNEKGKIPRMSANSFLVSAKLFRWKRYAKALEGAVCNKSSVIWKNALKLRMDKEKQRQWDKEDELNYMQAMSDSVLIEN